FRVVVGSSPSRRAIGGSALSTRFSGFARFDSTGRGPFAATAAGGPGPFPPHAARAVEGCPEGGSGGRTGCGRSVVTSRPRAHPGKAAGGGADRMYHFWNQKVVHRAI